MNFRFMAALAIVLGLYGCERQTEPMGVISQDEETTDSTASGPDAEEQSQQLSSGIDFDGIDTEVRPQDDLFDYANGKWVRETELPPDRARWGAFHKLHEKSQEDVRKLVEEVSQEENVDPGSATQKIRDFYNAYMDTEAATQRGVEAIRSELDLVAAIESRADLFRVIGELGRYGVDSPIGGMIYSDLKAPDTAVVYLGESGITLPDRDYYLKDDEQFVTGRELFRAYVARLFELAGIEDGQSKADSLLALEHRLAEAAGTQARRGALDPGRQSGPGQELQSDDARRSETTGARH
jgi:predicted metalloendopeptidase